MWILPTLSRPKQCAAVLGSLAKAGPSNGVVFLQGTSLLWEYQNACVLPDGWTWVVSQENIGAIGALNKVFEMHPSEPWYGFWGDDEFLAEAPLCWQSLLASTAGDWNLAHGYENWNHGRRFQGGALIGGELARAVGYLAVPNLWHGFGFDCAWEWLCAPRSRGGGGVARNILVPEIKVDHRHWMLDENRKDECYQAALDQHEKDKNKFWDWVTMELPIVAERVREKRERQTKNT